MQRLLADGLLDVVRRKLDAKTICQVLPHHELEASVGTERAAKIEGLLLMAELLHKANFVQILNLPRITNDDGSKQVDLLSIVGLFGRGELAFQLSQPAHEELQVVC